MTALERTTVALPAGVDSAAPKRQWLQVLRQAAATPRGGVGVALTAFVVAVAIVGPHVAPYSPTAFVTTPYAPPSAHFLLGGDTLGRDVLSRLLSGGGVLLLMALAATGLGVSAGVALGVTAAYRGSWQDTAIMRGVDVVLAMPQLVFALLLVSIIGPKLWLIVVAVGISHAPQVARVMRSAALEISRREYVRAVELQGMRSSKIVATEILPNLISPVMVEAGLRFTYSMIIIAGLAFLGFGQSPPAPNWGVMVNENRIGLALNPWAVIAPAMIIVVITIGVNLYTDAVTRVGIGVDRRPEEELLVQGTDL